MEEEENLSSESGDNDELDDLQKVRLSCPLSVCVIVCSHISYCIRHSHTVNLQYQVLSYYYLIPDIINTGIGHCYIT